MDALLVQLHAAAATHQGHQQAFRLVLQDGRVIAAQAVVEQPQAALQHHHADHQQGGGQTEARRLWIDLTPPASAAPA